MSKRILKFALFVMALLSSVAASADDFTVGDLKYTIIDGTQKVKVEAASKSISGAVVIPATVTNTATNTTYNVTEIADQGFHSCNMTSIVVPNSVTTLGRAAFANSTNLTDATIGSGVTALTCDGSLTYGGTFEMCNKLEKVTFAEGSQLTTVEHWAFHRCEKLKELVFPSTVTHIGHRVFYHCYALTRMVLPVSAVPTIITTPSGLTNTPPYNPFDGLDNNNLVIEVPAAVLPSFLEADIWKDRKYAMQLTGTNVANLALKSVFGTVAQNEIDSHGHLFITHADTQEAYWYLNNSQAQNVSFVLNACSYQDYYHNDLILSIISLADDGTETVHETQQFHLYNPNNTSGNKLQYKVDLQKELPAGRYKVKLNAVKDRIEFNNLYIGSSDKFYCAEYEVRPFGAGGLTPNKQTPNVQWYFTTPTDITLTAAPTDTWSTFANWTDEDGNVLSTDATSTFNVNGHKKFVANFNVNAQQIPTEDFNSQQAALYTTSDASDKIKWVERSSYNSAQFEYVHEGDIATYYVSSTKPALYNMKFKTSNMKDESANYTIEVADKDNNVIFTSATTNIAKTSGWYGTDMTEQTVLITVPLLPNETYTVKMKFGSANHSSDEICNYCDVNFELVAVVADQVALDKATETVKVGATTTLVATATASTNDEVTEGYGGVVWSSSNEAVATVANGVVTAISAGEAVITATGVQIPSAKASCTISVPQPVTSVTLDKTAATVYKAQTVQLTATVNPDDATVKTVSWTSSNEAVATVSNDGLVTAVDAGEATITVKSTADESKSATFMLTVQSKTAHGSDENTLYFVDAVNDNAMGENHVAWDNATDKNCVANSIVLADAVNFACPYDVAVTSLVYKRTFKNTSWQPLYVPFNMAYEEWAGKADVAKISGVHEYDDGTTLIEFRTVKSGEILPNVPYIIRAKATSDKPQVFTCTGKTLSAKPATDGSVWCASTERRYTLTGTYESKTGLNGALGMSGGAFYAITSPETELKAMRFCLTITNENHGYGTGTPAASAPSQVNIMVDGEATGITILGNEINIAAPAYNMQGVRVTDSYKGIVIQNGRKVLKK